jgi:GH18 family chitinase
MKTQGAASLGLGGVMMWEATLDGVDQGLLKVSSEQNMTVHGSHCPV